MEIKGRIITSIFFVLFMISCGGSSSKSTVQGGGGSTSDEPRIIVKRLTTNIFSGSGPYPFGNIAPSTQSNPVTFSIENQGGAALIITSVDISGDSTEFTTNAAPQTIAASGTYTFDVIFAPTTTGTKYAQINITHNDLTQTIPFTIKLTGIASVDVPEINLKDDTGNNLLSGTGTYNFGSKSVPSSTTKTFTIYNMGKADLTVTSVTSSDPLFVVTSSLSTIGANSSGTFDVSFNPTITPNDIGAKSAIITIVNTDSDETTYTFSAIGFGASGTSPEINVVQGTTNLTTGATYDFGNVNTGGSSGAITFTIQNLGSSALTISGLPISTLDFVVNTALLSTPVPAGGTTTFTVAFNPAASGVQNGSITIGSDDSDEGTYTINLKGTGIAPNITSTINTYTFVTPVDIGNSSSYVPILIENTGDKKLTVTNIAINGGNPGDFSFISPGFPFDIDPHSNRTISINFSPSGNGARSASIDITNNTNNIPGSIYNINISGTGVALAPAINIAGDTAFGSVNVGSSSSAHVFTIRNTGTGTMNVSNVTMTGAGAADFIVSAPGVPFTIAAGSSTSFTVVFKPTVAPGVGGTVRVVWDSGNADTPVTSTGVALAPAISIIGDTAFGSVNVGSSSSAHVFTISNTGTGTMNVSNVTMTGAGAADFIVSAPGVPFTIAAGSTASFTVVFKPTVAPGVGGTVRVVWDSGNADTPVTSTGVALAPAISIIGDTAFGSVNVGSPSSAHVFTIRNTGTGTMNVSNVTMTGAGAADFIVSAPGVPFTIAAGSNASFTVVFKPTVAPGVGGTVRVVWDSGNADTPVTSTGVALAPAISIIGDTAFGNVNVGSSSSVHMFTIMNTGNGTMNVASITMFAGITEFAITVPGAAFTIPAGGNYSFPVIFKPTLAPGAGGTLRVVWDSGNADTPLTGTGVAVAPGISIVGDAAFGSVNVGSSSSVHMFTIMNTGNGTMNVASITMFAGITEFAITVPGAAFTIPAGGNYSFPVIFKPTLAPGAGGTLRVVWDSGNADTPLTGTGVAVAPGISIVGDAAFGSVNVGSSSSVHMFTIMNTGNGTMNVASITMFAGITEFAITVPGAAFTIPAGGNYSFPVIFKPTLAPGAGGTLRVVWDSGNADTPLTGTGVAVAPGISIVGDAAFGSVNVGSSSSVHMFTIMNTGNGTMNVASITMFAGVTEFAITVPGAAFTIPAGGNYSFPVIFKPTLAPGAGGTLRVVWDSGNADTPLTGTGVTLAPAITVLGNTAFGNVNLGSSSSTHTFTIQNIGTGTMNVTGISMNGTYSGDYAITAPATPFTINAGNSASFNVVFTPLAAGIRFAATNIGVTWDSGLTNTAVTSGTGLIPVGPIDPSNNVGEDKSVKVLADRNADGIDIYICYYDLGNTSLKFAKSTDGGTTWAISTIDNGGGTNNVGQYNSMAIIAGAGPATDKIYISYYDATAFALKFAYSINGGTGWTMYAIETGSFGQYTSISAIADRGLGAFPDGFNDIYITYYDTTGGGRLKWARLYQDKNNNSTFAEAADWDTGIIDDPGVNNVGQYSSLAVNYNPGNVALDKLYVSYYDVSASALNFAYSTAGTGGPWTSYAIETGTFGQYTSIQYTPDRGLGTADGFDDIYITYYDTSGGGRLKWARLYHDFGADGNPSGTTDWEKGIIDSGNNVGQYSSVAVIFGGTVASDKLYVSYYDATSQDLIFSYSTDGGLNWSKVIVDSTGQVGLFTSLGFTGTNFIIGYYDLTNTHLKWARSTNSGVSW